MDMHSVTSAASINIHNSTLSPSKVYDLASGTISSDGNTFKAGTNWILGGTTYATLANQITATTHPRMAAFRSVARNRRCFSRAAFFCLFDNGARIKPVGMGTDFKHPELQFHRQAVTPLE